MDIEKRIKSNITLAPYTTYKIGGSAKYFFEAKNTQDVVDIIKWTKVKKVKFLLLAGGSNVLINDNGYDGLVIKLANQDLELKGERIETDGGVELAKVVSLATSNDLSGLEWAIAVPGTVGGALRGNAGAFGYSIGESVETIEVYNYDTGKVETLSRRECKFGYKDSIFKQKKHYIILKLILRLKGDTKKRITERLNEYLEYRKCSQPQLPSAGCVFKNLSIDKINAGNKILTMALQEKEIQFKDKVGAGVLIDLAGLKGKKIGGAKISLEHANFIINVGGASANDVIMLISYIKQQVRDKFGVQLNEEIEYFGFD